MMYSNKLAIAVKANGKVLREFNKDTAFVPFGSEYSLLIKNLNTVRVQVRVEIDGTDATEDTWLIIHPNSEMELTRFIKNGNLNEGNRFKFIERTAGVEQHRGVGVEDGLIRVEYQFEQPTQPVWTYPRDRWVKKEYWERQPDIYYAGNTLYSSVAGDTLYGSASASASGAVGSLNQSTTFSSTQSLGSFQNSATTTKGILRSRGIGDVVAQAASAPINDAGITVPGSVSDQRFTVAASFPVEATKHVMIIKLLGETAAGQQIVAPVTVKAKPTCVTCGHVNKANSKFCSQCGTGLILV